MMGDFAVGGGPTTQLSNAPLIDNSHQRGSQSSCGPTPVRSLPPSEFSIRTREEDKLHHLLSPHHQNQPSPAPHQQPHPQHQPAQHASPDHFPDLSYAFQHQQPSFQPRPAAELHHPPLHAEPHSQAAYHSPAQTGISPSLPSLAEPGHPSSAWSHNYHHAHFNDPIHIRHPAISSSAATISQKCLAGSDGTRGFPVDRLLAIPYPFDSHQQACSSIDKYPLALGPTDLDSYPGIATQQALNHPQRLSSSAAPFPQRRALHPMSNNQHFTPTEYTSRASSPPVHYTYGISDRLPPSPPGHYSSLFTQPPPQQSEAVLGQKRKFYSGSINEQSSPKSKKTSPIISRPSETSVSPAALDTDSQRMTTVLCLHASVAQKSYGQEKRFLCPPPLVRITGPYRKLAKANRPILSMSILNEEGHRHLCQTAFIGEDDSNVHFKSLHISGAAKKAKHVKLELSLHPPSLTDPKPTHNLGPDIDQLAPPFATFRSSDCNIISKPSKKTAKARNTQSCIFNGSTICLFNRINSQTVRTKYLCVQDGQLAARAAQWSAFIIQVVRRAEDAGADGTPAVASKTLLSSSIPGADRTVTYGSEVELIDFVTGVSSGPLVVRKVEKNKVLKDATGPVSQMQKLTFCQIDRTDGSGLYISALEGAVHKPTSPINAELGPTLEPTPNTDCGDLSGLSLASEVGSSTTMLLPVTRKLHMLQLLAPRATLPPEERDGATLDEIDDSVAWTVIGVSQFSHSFIDLSQQCPQIPQLPITPFPALISQPQIDLHAQTMTIRLTGFFDAHAQAMEMWLGPIGPLNATVLTTSGITLEAGFGGNESGSHDGVGANALRLHMLVDGPMGWPSNRRGARQETTLLLNMPPLETIYSTLHQRSMPNRAVVVLDETSRSMSEVVGRNADGAQRNGTQRSTASKHIPALPITLIRADGMSFVMSHSVCLSEVVENPPNEKSDDHEHTKSDGERQRTCVLKVI